jgi:tRNA-dihydrouridine synthase B
MIEFDKIFPGKFPVLLAPMENITDPSFRKICKEFGADIMFTEFISSEGLIREAVKSTRKLEISDEERPVGAQIFGHDIESMKRATAMAEEFHPDFIDLNFGCPVRKVVSKGAGAALLLDPEKMVKMTEAVVKSTSLPVTVKTRIGWDEKNKPIAELAVKLQDTGIKALTIHGRTRAQLYTGKADWTLIGKVKSDIRIFIPIIGNGDVDSPEKAKEMRDIFNVDGIMIGRAAIGNPWLFSDIKDYLSKGSYEKNKNINERISVCQKHLEWSVIKKGEHTGVVEMRKHYSGYFKGMHNFKPFRTALMQTTRIDVILQVLQEIQDFYSK